jgi:hypothetical protein
MEDCANKGNPIALAKFPHHFLTKQPQVDPLFDYFTAYLNTLWEWEYYHPIAANIAVSAMLDYASACYLEIMTEGMKVSPAAVHYPDYIRANTGVPDFYTYGLWPVDQFPDIRVYVQAVPSISRFISEFGSTSSRLGLTFNQISSMISLAIIKRSSPGRQSTTYTSSERFVRKRVG